MINMKFSPLVTVVITFFNQSRVVQRALRSVVNQTYKNLDIVVIDDGSLHSITDRVAQINDDRIRFYQQTNSGVAAARNLGIREARGQYIAFLDGDDVFLPQKIETLINIIQEKKIHVIASGCYLISKNGFVIGRRICGQYFTKPNDSIALHPKITPSLMVYDREIFNKLGGFPESFRTGEDGVFNRMVLRKYSMISLPKPLVLKEKADETSKSRKIFLSYDDALASFNQKIEYVSRVLADSEVSWYYERTRAMHLLGFLSMGNISGAKKWFEEVCCSNYPASGTQIVKLSIVSGCNFYRMVLRLKNIICMLIYMRVSLRYKRILKC